MSLLNLHMYLQVFIGFISQLRRAVVDHVSDSFLETTMPLIMMIEAAQAGNEREVEECAKLFTEHAAKLEEVRFGNWIPFVIVIIVDKQENVKEVL